MSVITFPRRVERRLGSPSRPAVRTGEHRATVTHQPLVRTRWRNTSATRRSIIIMGAALVVSLSGSMVVANRQVQLQRLQSALLQAQSNYAVQVGSMTNASAPSQIASKAGALHLVDPTSVTQVPVTSLERPLPIPQFNGYAPVTSRTSR